MDKRVSLLKEMGFVFLEGGPVQMGSAKPTPCRLEGYRHNETPVRFTEVRPFWVARCCVTNAEFERVDTRYRRPVTSPKDRHPVTDVTYFGALKYAQWLSRQTGIVFDLPTEEEWVFAAAPFGWEYPWGNEPDPTKAWIYGSAVTGPLEVDDDRFGPNWCGLYHVGGNVHEYVRGCHHVPGTGGAAADGFYCLIKGGGWTHCRLSPGVHRRALADVAMRGPSAGFRLVAHLDEVGSLR